MYFIERKIRCNVNMMEYRKEEEVKKGFRITIIVLLILSALGGFAVAEVRIRMDKSLNLMNRDTASQLSDVDLEGITVNSDTDIINILLIGSDARAEVDNTGRSDTVIIATLDKKNKRLKMCSLMRDMYVDIPGYGKDRFNAAYAYGGPSLLYKMIAENFGIQLDGYVEVGFDVFKELVDAVDGVEIELTAKEAEYLNTTNYISTKKYRNVVEGKQTLNGVQALGYTRVRKVATPEGVNNDQGRTLRQRKVIQSFFTKVKKMSMSQWLEIANKILPDVTTDLDNDEIISYMTDIVMLGTTEIDQQQIPAEGYYHGEITSGGADVLAIDDANKDILQKFIFEYNGEETTQTSTTQTN